MDENCRRTELSQEQILEAGEKLKEMYQEAIEKVPTVEMFNREFHVSWEHIAEQFKMTRNGFDKHRTVAHNLQPYYKLFEIYAKAVEEQATVLAVTQPKRAEKILKTWSENSVRYRELLEKAQEADEWFVAMESMDRIAAQLDEYYRATVLAKVKPAFEKLEQARALKLAFHYEGYAALGYLPFLGCLAVMTTEAQAELKKRMDAMTAFAAEHLDLLVRNVGAIPHCVAIRYENSSKEYWGTLAAWREFKTQAQAHGYFDFLTVAVLLLYFRIDDIEPDELDMVMTYAFCLTGAQREQVLDEAKAMLTAANLRAPHTADELVELFAADDMMDYMERLLGIDPIA